MFQKKTHKVFTHNKCGTVRPKMKTLHQNFHQKLLSTGQRKICVNELNILCEIVGSGYTSAD